MNWDDMKIFLVLCQEGSIRMAANKLSINHTTVSRRINKLELTLGKRLFDRETTGYRLTRTGEEIYDELNVIESRLNQIERKIMGEDNTLSGDIRITMPDIIAEHLLMPGLAKFSQEYPEIQIEIKESAKMFNLVNREADVAFRVVKEPPEYLIGRKLASIHRACYMSARYKHRLDDNQWLKQQNWIGWTDKITKPIGQLARDYPKFKSKHKIANGNLNAAACKEGMGVAFLPCFIGDADPELVRIPPRKSEDKNDLWILSHPDLRKNSKIQCFVRFMTNYLQSQQDLIEGRRID
ncbi:LysR family transcriptional regulator [Paraglaciecola sp.]|uniref:LysR family transcriptional regulator n=1 Tax=Paraglaciecola sp. TaxID=1920173 RepID=UPI003EFA3158